MSEIETRDKETVILETTMRLIAERGFHDTPVSLIAKRSGVSAGIIYHYFSSKDDLIQELYRRIKLQFSTALMVGEPQHRPFPAHLRQLWLNAYHFYVSHPAEALFLAAYENSPYPHDLVMDENAVILMDMIQLDMAQGRLKTMPFQVLYELTIGVALNLARAQVMGRVALDQAMLEMAADACVQAVTVG